MGVWSKLNAMVFGMDVTKMFEMIFREVIRTSQQFLDFFTLRSELKIFVHFLKNSVAWHEIFSIISLSFK